MANPMFEVLSGIVDGSNRAFRYSTAYIPGSTAVYLNGQLILAPVSDWTESNPDAGEITMTYAPKTRDVVSGFAMDRMPAFTQSIVSSSLTVSKQNQAKIACTIGKQATISARVTKC